MAAEAFGELPEEMVEAAKQGKMPSLVVPSFACACSTSFSRYILLTMCMLYILLTYILLTPLIVIEP